MKKTLKVISIIMSVLMLAAALTSCGNATNTAITVISREEGSGTRDAFTELLGIKVDDVDNTIETAEFQSSTSVVITSVMGNKSAIGYISLGSLNDNVKAVKVDGIEATAENVKNGTYVVARPFNIATKENISEVAADFIKFIMSSNGQQLINDEGYIAVNDSAEEYVANNLSGKVTIAGSTSVAPVMEKLTEAYKALNSNVEFEIHQTGSSAGMTSTIEGACDIGMASRDVKDTEVAKGITGTKIAMDGIAVIVNTENEVDTLTSEQIKNIYTGVITDWSEVK